jgi:hypothetical protein
MAERAEASRQRIYHIRVQGELDDKWGDWFEGFAMAARDDGETLLTGAVADSAELHAVLGRIHSLGLPLLLAVRAGCPCPKRNCPRRGKCLECAAYHAAKGKLPFCLRAGNKWDRRCAALTGAR